MRDAVLLRRAGAIEAVPRIWLAARFYGNYGDAELRASGPAIHTGKFVVDQHSPDFELAGTGLGTPVWALELAAPRSSTYRRISRLCGLATRMRIASLGPVTIPAAAAATARESLRLLSPRTARLLPRKGDGNVNSARLLFGAYGGTSLAPAAALLLTGVGGGEPGWSPPPQAVDWGVGLDLSIPSRVEYAPRLAASRVATSSFLNQGVQRARAFGAGGGSSDATAPVKAALLDFTSARWSFAAGARAARAALIDYSDLSSENRRLRTTHLRQAFYREESKLRALGVDVDDEAKYPIPDWNNAVQRATASDAFALEACTLEALGALLAAKRLVT